jgi:hypothetical protein
MINTQFEGPVTRRAFLRDLAVLFVGFTTLWTIRAVTL